MKEQDIEKILQSVAAGAMTAASALERLKTLPFEDLGYAAVDHHRTIRQGFPEVIYGEGKTAAQIIGIMGNMLPRNHPILATRIDAAKAKQIKKRFPKAKYYPDSRVLTLISGKIPLQGKGLILVISAGTSDIPVAEEALLTAQIMGNRVEHLYDVGVAGIHRLMAGAIDTLGAMCMIVVAGMEGALPSVVGGLVSRPGHRRAHQHRLRRQLRRHRGPARHAQHLRRGRYRGQHRQRLRRGLFRQPDQPRKL